MAASEYAEADFRAWARQNRECTVTEVGSALTKLELVALSLAEVGAELHELLGTVAGDKAPAWATSSRNIAHVLAETAGDCLQGDAYRYLLAFMDEQFARAPKKVAA